MPCFICFLILIFNEVYNLSKIKKGFIPSSVEIERCVDTSSVEAELGLTLEIPSSC